jgi:hypothetical protein
VAHAAAQIEDLPGAEERLAELIGGDMALPGGVEAPLGTDHPFARDLRDGHHLGTA